MGSWAKIIFFCILYFGSYSNTYAQFNCQYEKFDTESGLSHNRITQIIRDKEGFIWTSSWDGLNRYDGRVFKTYKITTSDAYSVANDRIDFITDDEAGGIWAKCGDNQIYRFNKATGDFDPAVSTYFKKRGLVARKLFYLDKGLIGIITQNDIAYLAFVDSDKKIGLTLIKTPAGAASSTTPIYFISKDSKRHIWIGGSWGLLGLSRSGKKGYSIVYRYYNEKLKGITSHDEDEGNMYFGTTDGTLLCINKLDLSTTITKVGSNRINAVKRSKVRPVLYCATRNGELIQVSLQSSAKTTHQVGAGLQIHSIYEDRAGALWLEPGKQGVIRFNPLHRKSKWFTHRLDGNENGMRGYHVFEDQTGRVWVNLRGGGLGYFNPDKDAIESDFTDTKGLTGRFPALVYSVYFDPVGIIWSCTKHGLIKINVPNGEFKQQAIRPREKLDLRANEVRGLLADRLNRLWVGTRDGSLKVYQGTAEVTITFDNLSDGNFGTVYHIFEDSKSNIWIGTKRNGLFKAAPIDAARKRYTVSHYFPDGYNDNNVSVNNNIVSMLEDKRGRLWAGTFGTGLYGIVEKNGKTNFVKVKSQSGMPDVENLKIRHMQLDVNNKLWLATTSGLYVIETAREGIQPSRIAQYLKRPGDATSLGENDIQYISRSRDKRMWLATSGGGLELAKFTDAMQGISFEHHLKNDGLLSDYILSVQEDTSGELWLGTERGLTRLNPSNGTARAYGSSEGLFDPAFSEGAVTRMQGGGIVFGTFKGILKFDPSKLQDDRTTTSLAFTNLQINNKDVANGADPSVSKKEINYTSHLDLSYNQNTISLDFIVLDFEHGADQNVMYRLKGYDRTWQNSQKQRRVTYTSLPPGRYVFEIKSPNEKLYTNVPLKRLSIHVAPPFWKTWWAYLFYMLASGAVILLILRIVKTILSLRESVRVEKKVAKLKDEFFTNISHELRTTLTLITNPLAEIGEKEQLSPKGRKYLRLIALNTERLTRFMNQWLDLRKIQSRKSELRYEQTELVSYVSTIAKSFAGHANHINLQITGSVPAVITAVDRNKMDLVFYNVLSNAYKYSRPNSRISIHLVAAELNGHINISVSDEGTGVPPEKLEDIFKLYYAGGAEDASGYRGTGIGLAVAREMVNLHGGKIWAENNDKGGLTVFISLPAKSSKEALPLGPESVGFSDGEVSPPTYDIDLIPLVDIDSQVDHPTLLLVEDNVELRELLAGQLATYYQVKWATNGEEGLKMALEHNPDLIVSDIMMPKMNGITMLDKLRNNSLVSHIPVILLTAKCSIESQIEGLKYGADYYLTKPFNMLLLLTAISNLIKQRQAILGKITDRKVIELSPGEVVITSKDETFLKKVIKTVEDNMHNPLFSIEMVADTMAMGRTAFYKKFKSLTCLTTVDFIRDMRLKRARQLMEAGEDRVSTVALEVGFNNARYFSTCFKEKYGISPSEYLKSLPESQKTAI